jgi:hypothetical protein
MERRIAALEAEVTALREQGTEKPIIPKGRRWANMKEATAFLGCSPDTITRYIQRGFLRRNAASRYIQIPVEDLENFVGKVTLRR